MKKIITILICLFVTSNIAFGQHWIDFNFDQDTNYKKYFYIDSSDVNNKWQIGKPQKSVFNAAHSAPNALLTDTVNHYPVNDSSTITLIKAVVMHEPIIGLEFYYFVNTDTINDYWKLEASTDNGLSWLDPDISPWFGWEITPPIFSGKSMGWQFARLLFLTQYFPTDTLLFRFTFISDSIESFKDGLMIDDISYYEFHWNVEEHDNYAYNVFYKGNEEIELVQQNHLIKKGKTYIEITDLSGRTQYSFEVKDTPVNNFKMPGIKDGIYLYAIKNNNRLIQSGKTLVK